MAKFTPEQIEALRLAKALGLKVLRIKGVGYVYLTARDDDNDYDNEVAPRSVPALACLDGLDGAEVPYLDLTTFEFPPMAEKSYLTVKVSLMDSDVVKELLEVCVRMSEDLDVPFTYRDEISDIRLRYTNWKESEYE